MSDQTRHVETEPQAATPGTYEPPQLWEYGSLRIDTAGVSGAQTADAGVNQS